MLQTTKSGRSMLAVASRNIKIQQAQKGLLTRKEAKSLGLGSVNRTARRSSNLLNLAKRNLGKRFKLDSLQKLFWGSPVSDKEISKKSKSPIIRRMRKLSSIRRDFREINSEVKELRYEIGCIGRRANYLLKNYLKTFRASLLEEHKLLLSRMSTLKAGLNSLLDMKKSLGRSIYSLKSLLGLIIVKVSNRALRLIEELKVSALALAKLSLLASI